MAFLPSGPRGGFAISTRALTRVGPDAPGSARLAVEGDGARHVLRLQPLEASAFLAALARERRAAGAPEIALGTPDGRRERPGPPPDDGGAPRPTRDERGGLSADGALERLLGRDLRTDPRFVASWLGGYVGLLDADAVQAARIRAETREAFMERPASPRAALLLWLVKQDYVFRRAAFPQIFDGVALRGRRLVPVAFQHPRG